MLVERVSRRRKEVPVRQEESTSEAGREYKLVEAISKH